MALQQTTRASRFVIEVEESTRHLRKAVEEAGASYRVYQPLAETVLVTDSVRRTTDELRKMLSALQSTLDEARRALADAAPARQIAEQMRRQADAMARQVAGQPAHVDLSLMPMESAREVAAQIRRQADAAMGHVADQRTLIAAAIGPPTAFDPEGELSRSLRRQSDLMKQLSDQQARAAGAANAVRQSEGASRSVEALARARERLLSPGVTLDTPTNIPRYHADPDVPDRLVRVLHGKREPGRFVDGQFKPEQ